jgi:hypothetical protein
VKRTAVIQLTLSIITGFLITWIDARPTWDDTGISAMMLLVAAAVFGYFSSQKPWLTALAISVWIPLFGIVATFNFGSLLALIPGFAGAYLGYMLKRKR